MAMLVEKTGLIRDRTRGVREMSYHVPNRSRPYMAACKKAHELICSMLSGKQRDGLCGKEMRRLVIQFVELDSRGRQALLSSLLHPPESGSCPLSALLGEWLERRAAEGAGGRCAAQRARALAEFFASRGMATTDDLKPGTAHAFMAWRSRTRFAAGKETTSASTVRKEIDALRQLARMAAARGLVRDGGMWDSVKVKAVAGVNVKAVGPLTVEEQRSLLRDLGAMSEAWHDAALLLLLTGIRLGELRHVRPDCFGDSVIALHGCVVGRLRTTGKTGSAARMLPVCPTARKLRERGNVFKASGNALSLALRRHFKGIHAHRLRHTFAVNKLLAQEPLKMVSYQMGHSGTAITSDLYGKFVPEHFKAGFEEAIRERKEHLDWLENRYPFDYIE